MSADRARVYVVHAAADNDRVAELVRMIESEGRARSPDFKIFFDRSEIRLASEWQSVMQQALSESNAAIVFLSPALFASHGATKELMALIRRRETDAAYKIIPVMLVPTEPPGFLKGYAYVDASQEAPLVPQVARDQVVRKIVSALEGRPVEDRRFQPTGAAEYVERLQSIRHAAARDEASGREPKG